MKTKVDLAPIAVDAVFVDVGRKIKADPPEWLPLVLQRFAPSAEADDLDWLTKKTIDAIDHLLRFLPALENLGGFEGERKEIRIVLGLLLQIREDFERGLRKGTGRPQDAKKLICAGVMMEAWQLCLGSVEPHSLEFREACPVQHIGRPVVARPWPIQHIGDIGSADPKSYTVPFAYYPVWGYQTYQTYQTYQSRNNL